MGREGGVGGQGLLLNFWMSQEISVSFGGLQKLVNFKLVCYFIFPGSKMQIKGMCCPLDFFMAVLPVSAASTNLI